MLKSFVGRKKRKKKTGKKKTGTRKRREDKLMPNPPKLCVVSSLLPIWKKEGGGREKRKKKKKQETNYIGRSERGPLNQPEQNLPPQKKKGEKENHFQEFEQGRCLLACLLCPSA